MKLNPKQIEAQIVLAGPQTHTLLDGGAGSGKTFLIMRAMVLRGLKAPGSRHAVLRFRFNHVRQSIGEMTMPKVMSDCFPGVDYRLDKKDWFYTLAGSSQIWLGGLDDKERTEKILGQEYATLFLNECSQISLPSRDIAVTRLRQTATQRIKDRADSALKPRMYYDCNPPSKAHWCYKLFTLKEDPTTGKPLPYPHEYARFGPMNPQDNIENLPAEYLRTLEALPERMRKRFLEGRYAEANPNALWTEEIIERWRVVDGAVPDFQRIVVGVDPSGSDDEDAADHDEIGVVVAALGTDGVGYVLEDCSLKGGPGTWGGVAVSAFQRHSADVVVGEVNFGGAMVKHVIQTARGDGDRRVPFKAVTASRGKVVRAEPISALFESGRMRFVGEFPKLEEECLAFSTTGYMGQGSPNRADAMVWAAYELFPGLVRQMSPVYRNRPEFAVM